MLNIYSGAISKKNESQDITGINNIVNVEQKQKGPEKKKNYSLLNSRYLINKVIDNKFDIIPSNTKIASNVLDGDLFFYQYTT